MTCARCGVALAMVALGCDVAPRLELHAIETREMDGGSEAMPEVGMLDLGLLGESSPLRVMAWRITSRADNRTVAAETLNLSEGAETLALFVNLDPGAYRVEIRGTTPEHNPCLGTDDFEVERGQAVSVEMDVVCDEQPLAVGTAELTVANADDSQVVLSRILTVDEALGASSLLEGLPPGEYVVWITATSDEGSPCAGSSDLSVVAGQEVSLDVLVECRR